MSTFPKTKHLMKSMNSPKDVASRDAASRDVARRGGFTLTELIVAATLLVAAMSVVGSLTVRSGRLWQDSRHYRLAIDEVTNHLERLTTLDEDDRVAAIDDLVPSEQIQHTLPNPVLTSELLSDEYGTRLVLSLTWDRPGKSTPVTLVGWVDPSPQTAKSEPKTPEPKTPGTESKTTEPKIGKSPL